jgi:hypothetical protein
MNFNAIRYAREKIRQPIPKMIFFILIIIIVFGLIFFKVIKMKTPVSPVGWVRIGCDDNNSNFFAGQSKGTTKSQTRLASPKLALAKLSFTPIWVAEEFSPLPFRLVGGVQKMYYNLRTADLNSDGKLEILVGYQNKTLVLNSEGVFQYALPANFDFYQDDRGKIYAVACSLNTIQYLKGHKKIRELRTLNQVVTLRIAKLKALSDSKLVLLATERLTNENLGNFQITCYEIATGQMLWSYQFELLPFVAAVGDVNQDSRNEIICTTYSPDKALGEVTALSGSGKLIWRIAFNYPDSLTFLNYKVPAYTEAAIGDLNGDGKQEVVAVFGTEDGKVGRIKIIEGKTGKVLDQFPKNRFLKRAFTSLGLCDFDQDGKSEIVTATRGRTARLYSFRMGVAGLETLATRRYYPPFLRESAMVSYWIWALADIDADNEIEILGSIVHESPVLTDWTVRTTQFIEPDVLVFDERLGEKGYIDLEERCLALVVSDLIKGATKEILVLTDRLYLYALP